MPSSQSRAIGEQDYSGRNAIDLILAVDQADVTDNQLTADLFMCVGPAPAPKLAREAGHPPVGAPRLTVNGIGSEDTFATRLGPIAQSELRRCTLTSAHGSLNGTAWTTHSFGIVGGEAGAGYISCGIAPAVPAGSPSPMWTTTGSSARRRPSPPQLVSRDVAAEASRGRRRERTVVWMASQGGLFAAVADSSRPRLGAVRRLAADRSVRDGQVMYETGPRNQVVVAWLTTPLAGGHRSRRLWSRGVQAVLRHPEIQYY